jgi:hypothetical protein
MFEVEARRLSEILLAQADVSPLLNLGSGDRRLREELKPHIEQELFARSRDAGVTVVHSDLRPGEGVDAAGDILDPTFQETLRAQGFRAVLAANLLEHVRDPAAVAGACEAIVGPGGLILATVPSSFPYHADPLDSGWRPTPEALAALFARSQPLLAEEVAGMTYAGQIRARGLSVAGELARTFGALLVFPIRPKSARARLSRWRWYRRPYRVSIALVRVR